MPGDDRAYLDQIRALSFGDRTWSQEEIEQLRDFLAPWNHNLRLAPGIYTAYTEEWYPEHETIMALVDRHLGGGYTGKRLLDLGCLEGYFSLEAAMHGTEVIGVDAREINVKKCEFARSVLGARNARFVLDDATEVTRERYGSFDVVLALGLLYHLDDPYSFLQNVAGLCGGFMVLDTLVALEQGRQTISGWEPSLSELQEFSFGGRSYRGRLYREFEQGADEEERAFSTTASHRNDLSVWLTEESLVAMLADVGFEQLEKLSFPRREDNWWSDPGDGRVLYVAAGPTQFSSRMFR
jgi:2-polyprenyl-3-methyl-5-hydroxy-6-metoxy-1,4-benzoquinol methylase